MAIASRSARSWTGSGRGVAEMASPLSGVVNPYRQRRSFVGRRSELAALSSLLGGGQSALLVGGRRTGKTTLLERLPEPGRPIVRCDAAGWDLSSEAAVRDALATAVIQQRGAPAAQHAPSRADLEAVLAGAAPLILAIDEADRLLGEPWSGGFLSFLRYLDDSALRTSVGFLLAGGPMLAAYRSPDDLGSPPLNTAEPVFISPLARNEVAELAHLGQGPLDLTRLWADAAGHPHLLSGLLARIFDGLSYDDAVDGLLDVSLRDFSVWHRQLGATGRAFLERLPPQGVNRQELAGGSWMHLREGYVLARCTCLLRAEDGLVQPGPGLFSSWLASRDATARPPVDWDLAISYASEDERLAAAVHAGLKSRFRVFFAADQQAYLWGEQLGTALPKLYGERSRYVLVISSVAYVAKYWPQVEFDAAAHRAGGNLLVINAGQLPPGMQSDVVYRGSDPASMVTLISALSEKLARPSSPSDS